MSKLLLRDLSPGADYNIQLRSRDEDTVSDWSPLLSFTTETDDRLPSPPTAVSWTSVGRSFVGTWTPPTTLVDGSALNNLDHYELKITYSGTDVIYITKAERFDFTFEMNEAKFGHAHSPLSFSVRAVTNQGVKSDEAFPTPNPAANPVPGAVTIGTIINGVEQITVPWTAPTDIDLIGYNVYASQTNGFTPGPANLRTFTNSLQYTFATPVIGTWYFHVRAVDIFLQESTSTQVSGTSRGALTIDTTAPAAPTGVAAVAGYDTARGTATMAVSWTLSTDDAGGSQDVRNYIVRYSADGGTNYDYVTVTNGISSTRFDVVPGATYTIGVAAQDFSRNTSAYAATTPTTTTAPVDAISVTPSAPTAVGNTLQVQVSHDNLDTLAATMPANVTAYEVYASKTNGFTTYDSTTLLGKIIRSGVTSSTFYLPVTGSGTLADTWYIKVRAIGRAAGVVSAVSAQTTVVPGLIQTANIADAQITTAKINTLNVDKLRAGNGIIDSLTIGNGTTAGDIHSFDYLANTTGWKIGGTSGGSTLLEINSGLIKAKALELSNSPNLIPALYADFEARSSAYTWVGLGTTSIATSIAAHRYGQASLQIVTDATGPSTVYLGTSTTDYNVPVEAGKTYIISTFMRGAAGSEVGLVGVKYSDATFSSVSSFGLTTSFIRNNRSVTIPTGVTAMVVTVGSSTPSSTIYTDGVQVEEVNGASTTVAQPWAPPSSTVIDGGQVLTGSIQSINNTTTVDGLTVPYWFIDTQGAAQFSDLRIIGNITVGGPTVAGDNGVSLSSDSAVQSYGFTSFNDDPDNAQGWRIDASGSAEFNGVIVRGTITVNGDGSTIDGDLTMTENGRIRIADGDITMGPNVILIGNENASHIVIDPETGLTLYDTTGSAIAVKLDMSSDQLSEFSGKVNATDLAISNGMTLGGTASTILNNAVVTMAAVIASPTTAPSLTQGTATTPWYAAPIENGLWWDGTNWLRLKGGASCLLETITTSGGYAGGAAMSNTEFQNSASRANFYIDSAGVVKIGSYVYMLRLVGQSSAWGLGASAGTRDWHLVKYAATGGASLGFIPVAQERVSGVTQPYPTLGYDGTDLLIGTLDAGKVELKNVSSPSTSVILKISPSAIGVDPTLTYSSQFGSFGSTNGKFIQPNGVAIDSVGNIFVVDSANNRVQKFTSSGTYNSQFGTAGSLDGQFSSPSGIAIDASDNLWITDYFNNRVQKFSNTGTFISKFGTSGSGNGQFSNPSDIAINSLGEVYVVDSGNYRVQKFTSSGTYVTKFGSHGTGSGQFGYAMGIAIDSARYVYIVDNGNHRVQKFNSVGTYQGQFGANGTGNGQFKNPTGIAIDNRGNLIVSDTGNDRIQKFTSSGTYITKFGSTGTGNGQFNDVGYLETDSVGNIWVADFTNSNVQKISNSPRDTAYTFTGGQVYASGPATFVGIGNYDYGSSKVLFGTQQGMLTFTVSGTVLTFDAIGLSWATDGTVFTLAWNGSNFFSTNGSTAMRKYSNFIAGLVSSANLWAEYAWTDPAGTVETTTSLASSFTLLSRRYLTIAIPKVGSGTNKTRVYIGSGASLPTRPNFWKVLDIANTKATSVLVDTVPTSGTNPQAVSGFLTGTPGLIQSATGGFIVKGDGTGDWPSLRTLINTQRDRTRRHVTSGASVNVSSSGATRVIPFGTVVGSEVGLTYDSGTNMITVAKTGRYHISFALLYDNESTNGSFTARVMRNGSTTIFDRVGRVGNISVCLKGSITLDMVAGDTLSVESEHNTGVTQSLTTGSAAYNYLAVTLLDS